MTHEFRPGVEAVLAAFLDRLRGMLVMEEGSSLWLARGTPRAWLRQGEKIAVQNMPTHFGTVDYEIVSDVDHGRITATVTMPSRRLPNVVLLRLRHAKAAAMQRVIVNGEVWKDFDAAREFVRLYGMAGRVRVEAAYAK